MRIYLAHPYTGDEEKNRERALKAEELLRKATPNAEFFNPVGRMTERFRGMSYAVASWRAAGVNSHDATASYFAVIGKRARAAASRHR